MSHNEYQLILPASHMGIHSGTARIHCPRVQLLICQPLVSPAVVIIALIKTCWIVMSDQTETPGQNLILLCSGM